jgi:hypothetical protein
MSSQDPPIHLTFDQWRPYIQPFQVPPNSDLRVAAHVEKTNILTIRRRIQLVNELYEPMKTIWPDGSAFDFCIALELEPMNDENVLESLQNPEFIIKVLTEAERRGIKHNKVLLPTVSPQKPPPKKRTNRRRRFQFQESSSDDDDDFNDEPKRKVPSYRWFPREIKRFKELITELAQDETNSWWNVVQNFPGRTIEECETLYRKLHKSGELQVLFNPKDEILRKKVKSLVCLEFKFKETRNFVGQVPDRFEYARRNNPLINYIDQISGEKLIFPAVSPDFYVLDYFTWTKCFAQKRCNPYTKREMSLQDLILLTFDNIGEFYQKIVNLDESRPKNPEEDLLETFLANLCQSNTE